MRVRPEWKGIDNKLQSSKGEHAERMVPFFQPKGAMTMENRISVVTIIVADKAAVPQVNACLHEYGGHIIGPLGVPYGEKGVSVICVIMDAPGTTVSALSGKLGMISGVSSKTVTAKD